MITDTDALTELRSSWNGVRIMREKLQAALLGSFSQGASFAIHIADIAHNLPFVHACSTLNEVLIQLSKENKIKCNSIFLGPLIKAGKTALPWKNYDLIDEAVKKRKEVAHKGLTLNRADCWKYINAIEEELKGWQIL